MSENLKRNTRTEVENFVPPEITEDEIKGIEFMISEDYVNRYLKFCAFQSWLVQAGNNFNQLSKMLEVRGSLVDNYFETDSELSKQIKVVSYFLDKGYDFINNSINGEVQYNGFVSTNWWQDETAYQMNDNKMF